MTATRVKTNANNAQGGGAGAGGGGGGGCGGGGGRSSSRRRRPSTTSPACVRKKSRCNISNSSAGFVQVCDYCYYLDPPMLGLPTQ